MEYTSNKITGKMNNTLVIDIEDFCNEIVQSAKDWLQKANTNPQLKNALDTLIKRHSNGLKPYIIGTSVIG